ncbi:NifB/MoaA-like Fe-S oxidoreductase [Bacillus fengqiuensis]|nr:NifB/MoaA-like Fe-S oxidoreductase [Bacillus fengqiuensis]
MLFKSPKYQKEIEYFQDWKSNFEQELNDYKVDFSNIQGEATKELLSKEINKLQAFIDIADKRINEFRK